jgi:anti-sigma factor ChrR (cupin superfamily)
MQACEQDDRASLYALGLLDEAEVAPFERHLESCVACAAQVRESGDVAAGLASTIPASAPPAELRGRVLSEALLPRGVVALARGAHLEWRPTPFPGVTIAQLYADPVRGELASLVRMSAGSHYPSHRHASLEHCYVLEGDLIFEDYSMAAGDYSAGCGEQDHSAATTRQGCLLFIVHNTQDQVHARA